MTPKVPARAAAEARDRAWRFPETPADGQVWIAEHILADKIVVDVGPQSLRDQNIIGKHQQRQRTRRYLMKAGKAPIRLGAAGRSPGSDGPGGGVY